MSGAAGDHEGMQTPLSPASPMTASEEMLEFGLDPMGDLRSLGYEYRGRRLLQVGVDEGFQLRDQEHYDQLSEAAVSYVALLLEDEANLRPVWLPLGIGPGDGCPIFVSEGIEDAENLLVVLQGSGRVRAGVWGCALCINQDLDQGTALPLIKRAISHGYGVLILNPNQNTAEGQRIPGLDTPERHVAYVWDHVIASQCRAGTVDVIAHSNGGRVLMSLMASDLKVQRSLSRSPRIRRVVFTDSYHTKQQFSLLPLAMQELLGDSGSAVNFVPHHDPLGTPVEEWTSQEYHMTKAEKGCQCLSAGTLDHASTNHAALEAILDFLLAGGLPQRPTDNRSPASEVGSPLHENEEWDTSPIRRSRRYRRTSMLPETLSSEIVETAEDENLVVEDS